MKKILLMALVATGLFAVNSYAAGTALASKGTLEAGKGETIHGASATGATSGGAILGRLSKGVQLGVAYTDAAYSLNTKHLTGSKVYGTSFDSTAIYSKESKSGDKVSAPTKSDSSEYGSGWTAM